MGMQKLGTVRRKYHITAADSAHACYFMQVNSRWENFNPFTLPIHSPPQDVMPASDIISFV